MLLAVNVILVVGHEKLNVEMQRTFGEHINVVKVPKSGGVRGFRSCTHLSDGLMLA
jgi:hypothetical protein